MFMVSFDKYVT